MIPREKIDEVRERTNLVEVVKRHVELKRAGTGSWKGLCPFHTERTPSFHVHEQRQFFHCFGCEAKGDVFRFLEQIEQRTFMEVLRDLAREAGVELPERQASPAERRAADEAATERSRMTRAIEVAVAFFEAQYAGPAGEAARAYVTSRGISAATAARFRIGYAPARWDALQAQLTAEKIPLAIAEQIGLVGVNERGRYDFFRDRVMLPVIDRDKRVLGFSSRLLDPQAKDRKYVNSPDSPLFHKKEALYGLHAALEAIRKNGTAIVVEGNFDVLALHEAGIAEAVAPMGTALTAEQITKLGRCSQRVVLVFDGDAAGERASRRVLPLFIAAEVDGRVAKLPAGVDPDDFVRAPGGAEAFRRLVSNARPLLEQFIDDVARDADPTIPGRVEALERAAAVFAGVQNATARELYSARLAAALGLPTGQVLRAVRAAAYAASRPMAPSNRAAAPSAVVAPSAPGLADRRSPPPTELEALRLIAAFPDKASLPAAQRIGELLAHDASVSRLYRAALDQVRSQGRLDVLAWLQDGPSDVRAAVERAIMTSAYEGVPDVDGLFAALATRLERARIEEELKFVRKQSEAAQRTGDRALFEEAQRRAIELGRAKLGLTGNQQRPN